MTCAPVGSLMFSDVLCLLHAPLSPRQLRPCTHQVYNKLALFTLPESSVSLAPGANAVTAVHVPTCTELCCNYYKHRLRYGYHACTPCRCLEEEKTTGSVSHGESNRYKVWPRTTKPWDQCGRRTGASEETIVRSAVIFVLHADSRHPQCHAAWTRQGTTMFGTLDVRTCRTVCIATSLCRTRTGRPAPHERLEQHMHTRDVHQVEPRLGVQLHTVPALVFIRVFHTS